MISRCLTQDIAMLRWIRDIKSLKSEVRHVDGKDNVMVDMLFKARYDGEVKELMDDEE